MSKGNKYCKGGKAIANKGAFEENYLISILDSLVVARDFTYGEFNNVLSFGSDIEALREAEGQYPELGIARYGTLEEGVSTISLLATVTSVFCGKRLGVILQEDDEEDVETPLDEKLILGFTLLDNAGAVTDSEGTAEEKEDKPEEDLFESDPAETKETEFTYTRIDDKKDETKETEDKTDREARDTWEVEDLEHQLNEDIPDEAA